MIQYNVIEYYSLKKNISLEESILKHDLLEMFLLETYKGNAQSPNNEVDDVWHNFILHTIEYQNYCIEKFGGLVHHIPNLHSLKSLKLSNECDSAFNEVSQLQNTPFKQNEKSFINTCDSQFK